MVGIRNCVSRDIKRLVKVNTMVIDKKAYSSVRTLLGAYRYVDTDVSASVLVLTVLILISTKNGLEDQRKQQILPFKRRMRPCSPESFGYRMVEIASTSERNLLARA